MRFDKIVDKYIKDNSDVLNIPKNSLCSHLFSFNEGTPPVLLESVRLQLLNDIERIAPYIKVTNYYMTGECITPTSTIDHKCDVIVLIEFANYNGDNITHQRAYQQTKKLNGHFIDRSQHKVYYYMYNKPISTANINGAFDILNNKWIKVPAFNDENFD